MNKFLAGSCHVSLCKNNNRLAQPTQGTFCTKAPNIPKVRPIEDFWSILADMVYKRGLEATNAEQLANRIKIQLKKIDMKVVQTMTQGVCRKLGKI